MSEELYFTVTGFTRYFDLKPFRIGALLRCCKEPNNRYDSEAINVSLPMLGTIGYVANSPSTMAGGTMSAGRLSAHVGERFHARVMFTTRTKAICRVETSMSHDECEEEIKSAIGDTF
ncbi:MAG: hypothetical protein GX633_04435 [Clostridiales bacterium]|nr:hypothetical protein [Clostridiales bacterium]